MIKAACGAGHRVIGLVRSMESAEALERSIPENAICCVCVQDLAHPEQLAVHADLLGMSDIDVLVNNAGKIKPGPLESQNLADAKDVFAVNYFSPLALIQAVLPGMRRRRSGTILNISSLSAHAGLVADGIYAASKAALERSTESLHSEVGPLGIRVSNIVLGKINTAFGQSSTPPEKDVYTALMTKLAAERSPGGEDPADIAEEIMASIGQPNLPLTLPIGTQARQVLQQLRKLSPVQRMEWLEKISAAGWWRAHHSRS